MCLLSSAPNANSCTGIYNSQVALQEGDKWTTVNPREGGSERERLVYTFTNIYISEQRLSWSRIGEGYVLDAFDSGTLQEDQRERERMEGV